MSVEKIRRVANVKDFDFINPSDYDISLDIVKRKLIFNIKEGIFDEDDYYNHLISAVSNLKFFDSLQSYDVLFYEAEDGCIYSLFNVLPIRSNPLTFSFGGLISNVYISDIYELKNIDRIKLQLSSVIFPPIKRMIELDNLIVWLDFSGGDFILDIENKGNLFFEDLRKGALLCVKLLSLIFYSPLKVEKETLLSGDLVYEYMYGTKQSGNRFAMLIDVRANNSLLDIVFTQDNLKKFLDSVDIDYFNLLSIYISLLDKENSNVRNINDFFLIQLIISLVSKFKNKRKGAKDAIKSFLKSRYIIQFNFDELKDGIEFSEFLKDKRHYVGHLFILFNKDGERIYNGSKCLEIYDYYRLLLTIPFYIYDIFGMTISKDTIINILERFNSRLPY